LIKFVSMNYVFLNWLCKDIFIETSFVESKVTKINGYSKSFGGIWKEKELLPQHSQTVSHIHTYIQSRLKIILFNIYTKKYQQNGRMRFSEELLHWWWCSTRMDSKNLYIFTEL